MANKTFSRMQAREKEVKVLFAEVTFGATGAPTLTSGMGVTSVTRNSTGDYTFVLDDSYPKLMSVHVIDGYSSAVTYQWMLQETTITNLSEFDMLCVDGYATGAVIDPQQGAKALVTIFCKNSTV